MLASDGVANQGVTDSQVLTDEITQAGDEGIHLVTVGYGMGNYNDHLMEQLADLGDGFYSYIDTFPEAVELFVDDLTPTLTVVAEEAKVQVVFDDEVVARYRLIGYENRALDDDQFSDDTVDAGEDSAPATKPAPSTRSSSFRTRLRRLLLPRCVCAGAPPTPTR